MELKNSFVFLLLVFSIFISSILSGPEVDENESSTGTGTWHDIFIKPSKNGAPPPDLTELKQILMARRGGDVGTPSRTGQQDAKNSRGSTSQGRQDNNRNPPLNTRTFDINDPTFTGPANQGGQTLLSQVGPFMDVILKRLPKYNAISPIGLLSLLSIVVDMSDKDSRTKSSLIRNWGLNEQNLRIETIKSTSDALTKNNFKFGRIFIQHDPIARDLQSKFAESDTSLTNAEEEFKGYFQKLSGLKIGTVSRTQKNTVKTLAQVMYFRKELGTNGESSGMKKFFFRKNNQREEKPVMTFTIKEAKILKEVDYDAAQVPMEPSSNGNGISIYFVLKKRGTFDNALVQKIHNDFSTKTSTTGSILLPVLTIKDSITQIESNTEKLGLLGSSTQGVFQNSFSMTLKHTELTFAGSNKLELGDGIDVKENKSFDIDIKQNIASIKNQNVFLSPFYVVLVDDASGAPLVVSHVKGNNFS
ncbi:hypothetical protein HMI54_007580 [Coelomomyces lativittatus]|nr:hypothetical protein HMI56_003245 [Coelomomyces lativittatus]KAJ1503964.1 hypothetical protein HMI54_007580 [Coelomomyces lativittatus]KAJ1517686.1 hypothetical protein HMI55_006316 [Coelomomyces lativittatus]